MITVLRFKDFQGPFTSNSKTFKDLFNFQGLSGPWKNEHFFQGLSRPCGHPAQNKKVDENQQKQTGRGTTIISSNENMKN